MWRKPSLVVNGITIVFFLFVLVNFWLMFDARVLISAVFTMMVAAILLRMFFIAIAIEYITVFFRFVFINNRLYSKPEYL